MTKKRLLHVFALVTTLALAGCASSKDKKSSDATDHTHTHEVIQERHYYHPSYHHHRGGGVRVSPPDAPNVRPRVGVGL